MKTFAFLLFFSFSLLQAIAQKMVMVPVTSGTNTSIRGMSIPADQVIWVSGSNGTIGRSVDGGSNWQWNIMPGYDKLDFRDIHAFDSTTAIVMAVDNPAYIFKTNDGGKTWKKTFEKQQNGMFLDAMDFKNEKKGICIGDPLLIVPAGKKLFYIIRTVDGGDTWTPVPMKQLPQAQTDEAIFSASGTNIAFLTHPNFEYAFVTGGAISNLFMMGRQGKPNKVVNIPIKQGIASTGTFSMATDGKNKFYCIGGDYKEPGNQYDNFYFTKNAGKSWSSPAVAPPFGYRSCIRLIDNKRMIACGSNGVDFSTDGGKEWLYLSKQGFNVCMVTPTGKMVYLAGANGTIAKFSY